MRKIDQVMLTMKASGLTKKQLAILEETINTVFKLSTAEIDDQTVFDKFMEYCKFRGFSKATILNYSSKICALSAASDSLIVDMSSDEISDFLLKRKNEQKLSERTINGYIGCFRSLYKWLYRNDFIASNPMDKIDALREHNEKQKAFTVSELEKLRNACHSKRDRAMIEFLLSTMCRRAEMCDLKVEDVNLDNMSVIIRHGKGNKMRTTYMNETAKMYLSEYLEERDAKPEEYLFQNAKFKGRIDPDSINQWMKRLAKRAGVEDAHPHKFRRTGATDLSRHGANPKAIQVILGHSNIATTSRYIDLSDDAACNEYRRVS